VSSGSTHPTLISSSSLTRTATCSASSPDRASVRVRWRSGASPRRMLRGSASSTPNSNSRHHPRLRWQARARRSTTAELRPAVRSEFCGR
jgi:hypothetical protein